MTDPNTASPSSDVLVARTVIAQMHDLTPEQGTAVARAIQRIGQVRGEPIRIDTPGAPSGISYFALTPADDPEAPIVIYRTMQPEDRGRWRVTALMPRSEYYEYRAAVSRGLLDDPTAKTLIEGIANMAAAGTISAANVVRPVVSPVNPVPAPSEDSTDETKT